MTPIRRQDANPAMAVGRARQSTNLGLERPAAPFIIARGKSSVDCTSFTPDEPPPKLGIVKHDKN